MEEREKKRGKEGNEKESKRRAGEMREEPERGRDERQCQYRLQGISLWFTSG